MISRLRGEILETEAGTVVLDVQGVGYEVSVPLSVLPFLPGTGETASLYIRQIFREDGVSLYGFLESFQRRIFDLLLITKGCGPKAALSLLGTLSADEIASAIQMEEAKTLSRAPGVGLKMAERIIVELRDKIQEEMVVRKATAVIPRKAARTEDELVEALLGLGYRRSEAEAAAEATRDPDLEIEAQLRNALKVLSR